VSKDETLTQDRVRRKRGTKAEKYRERGTEEEKLGRGSTLARKEGRVGDGLKLHP